MPDQGSISALLMAHAERAFNVAYWIVRDRADAEDVVQDALLRALRGYDRFGGDNLKAWLLTIVRNTAISHLRERRRRGNVVALHDAIEDARGQPQGWRQFATDEASAEDKMISADTARTVAAALAALSPAHRDVVVLREMEGLDYREIAMVTGLPIGTVMSRLARGREELRRALLGAGKRQTPHAL